jgi:membrane protein
VKYFSNHKAIYGALAALPVFLTWLYIIWLIILLGSVISWRFQQGLPLEEKERDETSYSPKQKMHFWRLQSLLPFFILVSIHNKFKTGDGKGINAITLAQQLNVSNQWIVEALKVLEDLNYIAAAQHQDAEMILEQTYFPTVPPEKIPSQKVVKELLEPTEYWLKNHKFPTSEPIRQVLSGFTKPSTEHPEKPTNLADMLAKIEAPAASQ